jgi:hypothetical protein
MLSDIVLSLFVTDILSYRTFYEQHMAVCAKCGRVSFETSSGPHTGCRDHPPNPSGDAHAEGGAAPVAAPAMTKPAERANGARRDATALPSPPPHDIAVAPGTDVDTIGEAWAEELAEALRVRSAWAHLGTVEVAPPTGGETLGGYMDRHTLEVPAGRTHVETLLEWRRTRGADLMERAVVYVNNALLLRAPPAKRVETIHGPWRSAIDPDAPAVVLGSPADVARIVRASRDATSGAIRGSVADVRAGLAVVLSGRGVACWIVAMLTLQTSDTDVTVATQIEVRSRPMSSLRRVDISLG